MAAHNAFDNIIGQGTDGYAQTSKMKSFGYTSDSSRRNMFMQSVLQYGKTRETEFPVIGSAAA